MKTRFAIIAVLIFVLGFAPVCFGAESLQAVIAVHCFDGDTIKLMDRRVVRLAGIDTPEVAHNNDKAQFYSREARQMLIRLVKGKSLNLEFPGVKDKDNYGRLVAEARLPDGKSVNETLVEAGAAFFYPHKDLNEDLQRRLKLLQEEAIYERRGMWKELLELPVAHEPYVGNKNSLRFFPASCAEALKIKPRNRVNFGNMMDAFLSGYAPARICKFWPEE